MEPSQFLIREKRVFSACLLIDHGVPTLQLPGLKPTGRDLGILCVSKVQAARPAVFRNNWHVLTKNLGYRVYHPEIKKKLGISSGYIWGISDYIIQIINSSSWLHHIRFRNPTPPKSTSGYNVKPWVSALPRRAPATGLAWSFLIFRGLGLGLHDMADRCGSPLIPSWFHCYGVIEHLGLL